MRAIILAAGEGSRLRPLTASKPKPMIRVGTKPILSHVIEALAANGVEDVTLVLGYHRERVQSYFEDGRRFGIRITYVFQEALLGTGHALAGVDMREPEVLVLSGDNIVDASIVKAILSAPPGIALVAKASGNPSKYGVVTLEGDTIVRIEEKPSGAASQFVNTGVYRITRDFHAFLKTRVAEGTTGLTHVLQSAIEKGTHVKAVFSEGLWADILYPWDVLALNARLVRPSGRPRPPGLHPSAVVEEPVTLGEDVEVGPNSVLLPTTSLGRNVQIGAGCILENCVVYDDVQIGAGSVLRNAVVGEGTRIGARVTALSGPCDVKVRDGWHELSDFGTVIGEDCQIDGAVTLKPGVLVGNRSRIAAGAVVASNADDGSTII